MTRRNETMTPNDYQALALTTETTPAFLDTKIVMKAEARARLLHGAIGLCTETGELQDALKCELIYNKPLDETNIIEECGDLLWYIALTLDAVDSTMLEAMTKNIAKLKARFPDGFTEHDAINRDLDAEREALESGGPR